MLTLLWAKGAEGKDVQHMLGPCRPRSPATITFGSFASRSTASAFDSMRRTSPGWSVSSSDSVATSAGLMPHVEQGV